MQQQWKAGGWHQLGVFLPYVLSAAWSDLHPSQALLLALLAELCWGPPSTVLSFVGRHLSAWLVLLACLPDPFPWWQAPLLLLLLAAAQKWWQDHPQRMAALCFLLLAPAMFDFLHRLQVPPDATTVGVVWNPWVASTMPAGAIQPVVLPWSDEGNPSVVFLHVPTRAEPWPLQADGPTRWRAWAALMVTFSLAWWSGQGQRRRLDWLPFLPAVLSWWLFAPPSRLELVLADGPNHRASLLLQWPLEAGSWQPSRQARPLAAVGQLAPPRSWVARGPLRAPESEALASDAAFLRHWADVPIRLQPGEQAPQLQESRRWQQGKRWEVDAQGLLRLRPLP